jgi:FkbM family methyltransferase
VNARELYRASNYWGWVEHDGYKMFLGKNDCGVAMRLRAGFEYEPVSMKLWADLCRGAELALDIGAHTGIYSLCAFRHGAKDVCAIEPFHLNNARLDLNLRANGYNSAGVWLGCALDKNGYTQLSVRSSIGYCSTGGKVGPRDDATASYIVPCKRMDTHIDESFHSKVGPIKIDVENSAKQVLAGMPKILSHKPNLLIEVTEDGLTEILKPYGYRFFMLDDDHGISEVESLEPERIDGRLNMARLNRWCQ